MSKNFLFTDFEPILKLGHKNFGENRVQEAYSKWRALIDSDNEIKLHMLGKVQSNKVLDVVNLFDYVHSLDSEKLAEKFSLEESKQNKNLKYFIQINIANEKQKSGIDINEIENFFNLCKNKLSLNIIGLMCLPPVNQDPVPYFAKLRELASRIQVKDLSMGMSNDYLLALEQGSTFIRIGSKIFGNR